MKYREYLTTELLNELLDSDLLILASAKGKLRLEGTEICFKGLRYGFLISYPAKISTELRNKIIDELIKTQLD